MTPVINNVSLIFEDLPTNFDGFTIMQISDIHIDASAKLADIIVEMITDLKVDL